MPIKGMHTSLPPLAFSTISVSSILVLHPARSTTTTSTNSVLSRLSSSRRYHLHPSVNASPYQARVHVHRRATRRHQPTPRKKRRKKRLVNHTAHLRSNRTKSTPKTKRWILDAFLPRTRSRRVCDGSSNGGMHMLKPLVLNSPHRLHVRNEKARTRRIIRAVTRSRTPQNAHDTVPFPDQRQHRLLCVVYTAVQRATPGSPTVAASTSMVSVLAQTRLAVLLSNTTLRNEFYHASSPDQPRYETMRRRRVPSQCIFDTFLAPFSAYPPDLQGACMRYLIFSLWIGPVSSCAAPRSAPQACTYSIFSLHGHGDTRRHLTGPLFPAHAPFPPTLFVPPRL